MFARSNTYSCQNVLCGSMLLADTKIIMPLSGMGIARTVYIVKDFSPPRCGAFATTACFEMSLWRHRHAVSCLTGYIESWTLLRMIGSRKIASASLCKLKGNYSSGIWSMTSWNTMQGIFRALPGLCTRTKVSRNNNTLLVKSRG